MTRIRCYIAPENWHGQSLQPDREETHHLLRVLRARSGDSVEAFDGQGRTAACRLKLTGGKPHLIIEGERRLIPPRVELALAMGLIRPQRMEWCIEKATELGIMHFVPLVCERSRLRPGNSAGSGRVDRWRRIAREAARQSGRAYVPIIAPPRTLPELLQSVVNESGQKTRLVLCRAGGKGLEGEWLRKELGEGCRRIVLLVGPEGDFTQGEVELVCRHDPVIVDLGAYVLRSETAGIYVVAIMRHMFGAATEESNQHA